MKDVQNLEIIMKEGFTQMNKRFDTLEKKVDVIDDRLKQMEWAMVTHKKEFEVLHGFSALHDEQIYDLRHRMRELSPLHL